jgi:hypothetical protein
MIDSRFALAWGGCFFIENIFHNKTLIINTLRCV